MQALFIMSSERSGSNLLRMMLGAHSRLAAPPPPHLWRHLTTALPSYGPLSEAPNFEQLVEDAVLMTQQSYEHLRWEHEFSPSHIQDLAPTRTLGGVISALYRAYAQKELADGWVCKENNLFDHVHQIREHLPHAKFLYLCRDGRDVACSIKDMPTHDQHIFPIAQEWQEQQYKCLRAYQETQPKGCMHIVRYEDLIEEPEAVLRELCSFADLDFEQRMLYFHETDEAVEQAQKTEYWENLSKPVMSDNKAKFRSELSARDVQIFEAAAGDTLQLLGYPLTTAPPDRTLSRWHRGFYQALNLVQRLFKRRELTQWDGRADRKSTLDHIHRRSERQSRGSFLSPFRYD
jgi:hypothetical protein